MHRAKVTANQITLWACVLSLVIGILFWFAGDVGTWLYLCLPVGLLIRMALNALDGMMARRYNQITRKGELLNEVGDVVSDTIIYFPLLKYHPESLYFIVAFIALSIINEYAGVMGKVLSAERRYDGPMGKSDRAFVLGLYGVVCLFGINLSGYSVYIFGVIDLLLVVSTWIRIKKTLKVTRNSQTPE
ncbi:CDP-alcohol phosphatidyltransferase family protein [Prevotella jejuni]|uniref:CDP-alcohol phosphatidyltransferase family protein n=1 Tax=Prevotella jejuni TaxID=1177574 RepID=UPI0028E7CEBC|nr:CDP-alcohol phosphatidyltransferase family protein [Prevotella jejuni]